MKLNKSESSISRESGIELLKIIATFLICISHCTNTMGKFANFYTPSNNFSFLIMKILQPGGTFGNLIFIVCSSYFLIDSKKAKKEKAINLLMDSQLISICFLIVFCITANLLSANVKYSFEFFSNNLFPDYYGTVWFIPAYFIFYLIHPILNNIVNSINKKTHFAICLSIFVFYGLFELVILNPPMFVLPCSSALWFSYVFFIVSYMKLYCQNFQKNIKLNIKYLCIFVILFILVIVAKNYLGLKFKVFEMYPDLNTSMSVVLIPIVLCAFNIFKSFKFKSKFINYMSSCTLFFYCIHENKLFREEIRPKVYEFLIGKFGSNYLLIYLFGFSIVLFVATYVVSAIYKETFHKFTVKLSIRAKNAISKFIDYANLNFSKKYN